MIDQSKLRTRIAKEVIYFFAALGIVGIIWATLLLRNNYYEYKVKNIEEKLITITLDLDSLPVDKIKNIYNGLIEHFVLNYLVNADTVSISQKEEKGFLDDFPNAKRLPGYPNGYSILKNKIEMDVFEGHYKIEKNIILLRITPEKHTGWRRYVADEYYVSSDSYVFDYVPLEEFRNFLRDEDYRDKFYSKYYSSNYPWETIKSYDLGTHESFEANVQDGLKFNKEIEILREQLIENKSQLVVAISNAKTNFLNNNELRYFLLKTLLIIGVPLYPFSIFVFLILWAIKTLKQPSI
jgi:hypothetical protein